jgi:alcohol dehydrogenase class IV
MKGPRGQSPDEAVPDGQGNTMNVNMLTATDWTFPVPIFYGPGRIKELSEICRRNGMRRPLLVTDSGSGELAFISEMLASLKQAQLDAGLFAELSPNPSDLEVAAGKHAFETGGYDGVVAVGGGSGMDGGKAISLIARRSESLWAFDFDRPVPSIDGTEAFVPLICIPTTAGTGAETESTAMITDTSRGIKGCVWHPAQKPRAAILDPALSCGLPAKLTAWTGCDALIHAIEAYCVPAWHPACDGIALEAVRLIYRWLPTAVNEPQNMQARGAMLAGSCLAGISFLKGLGLVHAISHMVGAAYDTHHGLTNAVVLPAVLRFNRAEIADKIPQICMAMNLPGRDFDALYGAICRLLDEVRIPDRLSELGIPSAGVASLAAKASRDPAALSNPRSASIEEIERLITGAIEKAR